MTGSIDSLLDAYDSGLLSRRGLLVGLLALAGAPPSAAETLPVAGLNHVSLAVSDVERSRAFYQDLFGAEIVSRQSNGINLATGPASFLGLYKIGQTAGSINHFCLGIQGFKAEGASALLEKRGIRSRIRDRDGVKELYFQDPDNIQVQLQDAGYRG